MCHGKVCALMLHLLLLLSGGPAFGQTTVVATNLFEPRGLDLEARQRLSINETARDAMTLSDSVYRVPLPISPTRTLMLKLRPFEVTTGKTRFIRATAEHQEFQNAANLLLLRGEIEGQAGSHAFLALTEAGCGSGWISDGLNEHFRLVSDRSTGKVSGLLVDHSPPPLPAFDAVCGMLDLPLKASMLTAPVPNANSGPRVVSVAVDADQSFTQLFESEADAFTYISQVVAAVSDIYMRDLDLKLMVNFVRIWPDGGEPFAANNLEGFRNYWIFNEDLTGLNLVHLMSGRRDLSYGGIAYLTDACSGFGFGISGFLLGGFPTPVAQPDLGTWDVVVVAHEMGHNLGAPHTHDLSPPVDTCANGTDERGTIMSYCHTRPGGLLNIDLRMHIQNQLGIAAENPLGNCLWYDCNNNGLDDLEDVASGRSADANDDSIPDECQDCDADGILNGMEILSGAPDLNINGIPDTCESDCNANGVPDRSESIEEPSMDQNGNAIPDSCEPDCDGNRIADFIDIADGLQLDLDRNSEPDPCQDCDGNGQPDWIDVGRQFNLYVGQASASLREYHAASGVPIQDFGPDNLLQSAYDVVIGSDRQLYVADFLGAQIVRVNIDTGTMKVLAKEGLSGPTGLAFGLDGHLYVCDQPTSKILKFHGATGEALGVFVNSSGHPFMPWDLAFGPDGHLYVVGGANRVLKFNGQSGASLGIFVQGLFLNNPRSIAFLPNGDALITSQGGNAVSRVTSQGVYLGTFNDEYNLLQPWGIVIGPNGNVYVSSQSDPVRLIEYDAQTGRYIRSFVRGDLSLTQPTQFAFRPASPNDANGNNVPDQCDPATCIADIVPVEAPDGSVNVDDLLMVIRSWGRCSGCPADIAPLETNGDGVVNVDDLLTILSSWGPCS